MGCLRRLAYSLRAHVCYCQELAIIDMQCCMHLQIDAQVERNDANYKAAFLSARGQHPSTGPTAGFSTNDFRSSEVSDPLAAFATSLALNKVCDLH